MNAPQALPGGPGVPQPLPQTGTHWDQDQVLTKYICMHFEQRKTRTQKMKSTLSHFIHFNGPFHFKYEIPIVFLMTHEKKNSTEIA